MQVEQMRATCSMAQVEADVLTAKAALKDVLETSGCSRLPGKGKDVMGVRGGKGKRGHPDTREAFARSLQITLSPSSLKRSRSLMTRFAAGTAITARPSVPSASDAALSGPVRPCQAL